jgi:hypothetical protein
MRLMSTALIRSLLLAGLSISVAQAGTPSVRAMEAFAIDFDGTPRNVNSLQSSGEWHYGATTPRNGGVTDFRAWNASESARGGDMHVLMVLVRPGHCSRPVVGDTRIYAQTTPGAEQPRSFVNTYVMLDERAMNWVRQHQADARGEYALLSAIQPEHFQATFIADLEEGRKLTYFGSHRDAEAVWDLRGMSGALNGITRLCEAAARR